MGSVANCCERCPWRAGAVSLSVACVPTTPNQLFAVLKCRRDRDLARARAPASVMAAAAARGAQVMRHRRQAGPEVDLMRRAVAQGGAVVLEGRHRHLAPQILRACHGFPKRRGRPQVAQAPARRRADLPSDELVAGAVAGRLAACKCCYAGRSRLPAGPARLPNGDGEEGGTTAAMLSTQKACGGDDRVDGVQPVRSSLPLRSRGGG